MWWLKLFICCMVDLFDFTVGRFIFAIPFAGEMVGCAVGAALFGRHGLWYGLEAIDPTEQMDGFIPTATIIALANRPD